MCAKCTTVFCFYNVLIFTYYDTMEIIIITLQDMCMCALACHCK
jgi:hypothetical protein